MMTVGRSSYEVHTPHTDTHQNQRWKYLYTHKHNTHTHTEKDVVMLANQTQAFTRSFIFPSEIFKESNRGNRLQSQIDIESIEPIN